MFLFAIVLVLLASYYLWIHPYSYWKRKGVEQGHPWILFGDSWRMIFRIMDMADIVAYHYNLIPKVRYYGIYQFLRPKLVVRDPDLIRKITVKDFDHFVDHVAVTDPKVDPLFSKNLVSLKGDEWRKMRATLTGSFTSSKMKVMFKLISEAAENFVKHFQEQSRDTVSDVEIKDAFTRFTIDVIATTAFGVEVNSLVEPENEFYKMGQEITNLRFTTFLKILLFQISPRLFKVLKLEIFRKEVNTFFRNLVDNTIETRQQKGIYRPDMLQILMDARKGVENDDGHAAEVGFAATEEFIGNVKLSRKISNQDITAQALIFFFAGFDSVSSLMTFAAYELALNNEVQCKLREEVLTILSSLQGKSVSYEDITDMKYMDMVISEALRKWPPFVIVGRECTKTYTIYPKSAEERILVIPKGMAIQIPCYAIHHDPKYYPQPEQFIPERFSSENRDKLIPYTFLTFGQGPRSCLGSRFALLEVKTVFFHLLSKFKLVVIDKTQVPLKLSKKFAINIRPEAGLWLGLERI
ncbi:cytochrome P450 9e2-like [Euwallacea similis]|uniref:cytochrome P450 9e2-like n=1 Tax=Euwallacea similis TaxID=1736056 RepID=UPI00344D959E